jgi:class 3 adenylate cyclase
MVVKRLAAHQKGEKGEILVSDQTASLLSAMV